MIFPEKAPSKEWDKFKAKESKLIDQWQRYKALEESLIAEGGSAEEIEKLQLLMQKIVEEAKEERKIADYKIYIERLNKTSKIVLDEDAIRIAILNEEGVADNPEWVASYAPEWAEDIDPIILDTHVWNKGKKRVFSLWQQNQLALVWIKRK